MNEVLDAFLYEEITADIYSDLFKFVNSESIITGTFECLNHVVMKISSTQFVIYRIVVGMKNTKCQNAVLVAKVYLLKKINSIAYDRNIPDIQQIY